MPEPNCSCPVVATKFGVTPHVSGALAPPMLTTCVPVPTEEKPPLPVQRTWFALVPSARVNDAVLGVSATTSFQPATAGFPAMTRLLFGDNAPALLSASCPFVSVVAPEYVLVPANTVPPIALTESTLAPVSAHAPVCV